MKYSNPTNLLPSSKPCLLLLALACLSSTLSFSQARRHQLTEVYRNNDFQLTGVSVSASNRLFVNFPRWSAEYLNAVVEVTPGGQAKPFPDESWNRWDLKPDSAARHFVCVQSIVVDKQDALWILDAWRTHVDEHCSGAPKLVQVDLKTDRVTRVIAFPPTVAKTNTYLNDVRFDDTRHFAYITDSGLGGIIVVDLSTGNSHRALDGDPSVMPDKSVKIVIDGKPVLGPTGETPSFHSDAIALSPDGAYLYYQPIAATTLYRVRTDTLRDPNAKPKPEPYAKTFPLDGIWMDEANNIYLSNVQADGVTKLTPDKKLETLVTDKRLQWPDTFTQGPDKALYITASHINQSPLTTTAKHPHDPYAVFKFMQ